VLTQHLHSSLQPLEEPELRAAVRVVLPELLALRLPLELLARMAVLTMVDKAAAGEEEPLAQTPTVLLAETVVSRLVLVVEAA
jgi:hypothetical protein